MSLAQTWTHFAQTAVLAAGAHDPVVLRGLLALVILQALLTAATIALRCGLIPVREA